MTEVAEHKRRRIRFAVVLPWVLFLIALALLWMSTGRRAVQAERLRSQINDWLQQDFDDIQVTRLHYLGTHGPFTAVQFGSDDLDEISGEKEEMCSLWIAGGFTVLATYRDGVGLDSISLHTKGGCFMSADRQKDQAFPSLFSVVPRSGPKKGRWLCDYDLDGVFEKKFDHLPGAWQRPDQLDANDVAEEPAPG